MSEPRSHKSLDKPLFEQLFKNHFVHLCNFAFQYINDTESARDIVQKVFVNLWESREKINAENSITSYLFTAVKSRCLNHIRDQKKYRSRVLDVEIDSFEIAVEDDDFTLKELKDKIKAALDELPEKCRLVFEMSRYQGKKYKEIAEELEISQKTVEAHMSKALKSLRANLNDYFYLLLLLLWGG